MRQTENVVWSKFVKISGIKRKANLSESSLIEVNPAGTEKVESFVTCTKEINDFIFSSSTEVLKEIGAIREGMDQVSIATSGLAKGAVDNCYSIEQANCSSRSIVESAGKISGDLMVSAEMVSQVNHAIEEGNLMIEKQRATIDKNREIVEKMVVSMENVRQKAIKIKGITKMLDAIARQTNLLSINASIEAARVGSHGNGFAVVAGEIRKLADDSKKQSMEIDSIISDINNAIEITHSEIETSKGFVDVQNEVVTKVVSSFDIISKSVIHIDTDINHILEENKSLENNIRDVQFLFESISAVSEQTAASTQQVSSTIDEQVSYIQSVVLKIQELNNMAEEMMRIIEDYSAS
ncbi:methyl-accepting chemotaxis protein (MCP) signaling protein [Anaerobacterium chartisolvens]|uniref:Methyl-accepting chemotaxis protein (MCP) signaling protein n=1 Tax=Anaerobacterium chartisolvens TaxID=1297424 RepID=A0A369AVV1_9FIRM|nr:methyl-accepting chemotaxis protein [Anaerobacterium chartisolvens]RCX12366.1 methyl-accepting chemotaxis protein (MCP) signaling protein [Anaerobacterium chartisolvens]